MPISHLKCFQNHLVVYCLAVKWESLWHGRHCKFCWRKPSSGHMTEAQPLGTLSLWNDLWLVKISRHGLGFSKAWKQSHDEEQKSSYLSEHLNYNMLKGYYGIFAQCCQEYTAYCHFKCVYSSAAAALSPGSETGEMETDRRTCPPNALRPKLRTPLNISHRNFEAQKNGIRDSPKKMSSLFYPILYLQTVIFQKKPVSQKTRACLTIRDALYLS